MRKLGRVVGEGLHWTRGTIQRLSDVKKIQNEIENVTFFQVFFFQFENSRDLPAVICEYFK